MSWTVALALGRVPVRRSYNRRGELPSACRHLVEVGDVAEPQQHAVADLANLVDDPPVVVFDLAVMELEHQHPSRAAASPSRWRMPREKPPAARRATPPRPASSSTSSTRRAGRPWECASHSRWLRALRLGCSAPASSSAPTRRRG
jgi:hypothetical protein